MGNESAIIIPIPEVEPFVGPLRLKYDAAARLGVPAHITLLYPFYPATAAIDQIENLVAICASIQAFRFSFTEARRFPSTAYLHSDKSESFVRIITALMEKWPDCKPYGGSHPEIIPHLTVADKVTAKALEEVERSLSHQLPISCMAREVWLLTSDHAGMWSKSACVRLAVNEI
ncbi:MAG: 2'-5' RNA ligase family protein [Candidatus Sulfotelmatobacter sp.]|jgi:2'-5' RNA ligase